MPDPQVPGPDIAVPQTPTPAPEAVAPEAAAPEAAGATPRDGERPPTVRDVEYKGAPLDAAKGPGLGCFWVQLAALAVLVVVTPLSVGWGWPDAVSGGLLLATLVLLLFAGQTIIFLLRLVAADRRAELRRAPLASPTKTVGQLEDESSASPADDVPAPASEAGDRSGGVPE